MNLNSNLKLLASALDLTRRDIAEIVTLGGVAVSSTRVDSWMRSPVATKEATGNSEAVHRLGRYREMNELEFTAFCVGLKLWIDKQHPQE